jgi:predicted lipoprotein with Yx(FWY)xxD motif
MTARRPLLLSPLLVVGVAACGAASPSGTTPSLATAPAAISSAAGSANGAGEIEIGMTSLGTVLTDAQGHTLYYLSAEDEGDDDCTLQPGCALMWPAIPPGADGTGAAGNGVSGTVGVMTASDGTLEVTYNGWPLHTFSGEAAGLVTGQGNASDGGIWYVATPTLGPTSNTGSSESAPALPTPVGATMPPGALPTNPFAPTTPPGIPMQPPLPTMPTDLPTSGY